MREIIISDRFRKLFLVVILFMFIFFYTILNIYQYFHFAVYQEINISDVQVSDSSQYQRDIGSFYEKYDIYQSSSRIALKDEDIDTCDIKLVIVNENGSAYVILTSMVKRIDVTITMYFLNMIYGNFLASAGWIATK